MEMWKYRRNKPRSLSRVDPKEFQAGIGFGMRRVSLPLTSFLFKLMGHDCYYYSSTHSLFSLLRDTLWSEYFAVNETDVDMFTGFHSG